MVLFGIMCAIAVGPYLAHNRAQQHAGSVRTVVSALRSAQAASVAENVTYRVDFDADDAKIYRRATSGTYALKRTIGVGDRSVVLGTGVFVDADGTTSGSVYFYPRGTASKGKMTVGRSGSTKTYTIYVEGLTARVSYE